MLQRQIFTECGPIHSSIPAGYQNIVVNMSIFSANADFPQIQPKIVVWGDFPQKLVLARTFAYVSANRRECQSDSCFICDQYFPDIAQDVRINAANELFTYLICGRF